MVRCFSSIDCLLPLSFGRSAMTTNGELDFLEALLRVVDDILLSSFDAEEFEIR